MLPDEECKRNLQVLRNSQGGRRNLPFPSNTGNRAEIPLLSVVIPCKNESAGLPALFDALLPVLKQTGCQFEVVAVDDGSTDDTLAQLLARQEHSPWLRVVELSRCFGKEAALAAGMDAAAGDVVVTMDADLQDPPDLILKMLARWRAGADTVAAVHSDRASDGFAKRFTAAAFYRLMNRISEVRLEPHAGDFRLFDRAVVEAYRSLPERVRFNKGLFAWLGFRQEYIVHTRPERSDGGPSRWGSWRLVNFAIDGITSFSSFPIRAWSWMGFAVALAAMAYAAFIFVRTLVFGIDVPGYASLMVTLLFFAGVNMVGVGLLGEYVGRIFVESKGRPLYVVRREHTVSVRPEEREAVERQEA